MQDHHKQLNLNSVFNKSAALILCEYQRDIKDSTIEYQNLILLLQHYT